MTTNTLEARVIGLRYEAVDITGVELRPATGASFPGFSAGAHIDVHLNNGLVRSYSLINPSPAPSSYRFAVLKDRNSRGGSRYIHDALRIGEVLTISVPRNHFELDETATHIILIAGGIGITPIYAMLKRLVELGRSVELIYCARSRNEAAFVDHIQDLARSMSGLKVCLHFDDEQGGPPDLAGLLGHCSPDDELYCCGPGAMLDAFETACRALGLEHVHMERFSAPAAATASSSSSDYTVRLARSGKTVTVHAGTSLLAALLEAGCRPPFSCREGICGACETKVLEGVVRHGDQILSKKEQALNRTMMICVSGSASKTLVLDL